MRRASASTHTGVITRTVTVTLIIGQLHWVPFRMDLKNKLICCPLLITNARS